MTIRASGKSKTPRRARRIRIRVAGVVVGAAVALAAPVAAQASEGGFLSPGFLLSFMAGPSPAIGYGGELSYMHYQDKITVCCGLGGFMQAQSYGDHGRYALGVQAGTFVGVELGAAMRDSSASFGRTWGVHAGVYGSIGFLTLGVRGTVPVVMVEEGGKPAHGGEIGLVIGVKLPIEIGDPEVLTVAHGRPLRAEGQAITAPARTRADWAAGAEPLVAEVDAGTRRALARAWLADAASEHASVAAFARLALDLLAVGAPADLVAQAHAAAMEEVGHARQCFALASAYAGAPLGPGALAVPPATAKTPAEALRALALESFMEGCLGEGTAAACARRARMGARDAAARATLGQIAREEARHEALGWAVVAWCVGEGGAEVEGALREALAQVEGRGAGGDAERAVEESGEGALAGVLAAHGRLSPAEARRARAVVERRAARRLRGMLGVRGGECGSVALTPRDQLAS